MAVPGVAFVGRCGGRSVLGVAQAWNCYSRARENVGLFGGVQIRYLDSANEGDVDYGRLQYLPAVFMLSMGVRYEDFPGKDESMMHVLVQELDECESRRKSTIPGYINHLLGRVYEIGIGSLPDKAKALEYYSRGKGRHAGCAEGWDRLQHAGN